MFKDVSIWCVILGIVILMFVHHILSNESLIEGNENVDLQDLEIADSLGYKIKLLGITELNNKNIKNFVDPWGYMQGNYTRESQAFIKKPQLKAGVKLK